MTRPAQLDDRTEALRRALYSPTSTATDLSAYAAAVDQRAESPAHHDVEVEDERVTRRARSPVPRPPRQRIGGFIAVLVALALVADGFALGRAAGGTPPPIAPSASATRQADGGAAFVFTRVQVCRDRPDMPFEASVIASSVRLLAERRSIGVSLYAALRTEGRVALLAATLQRRVVSASAPPRFATDGLALRFSVTTDPIDDAGTGAETAVSAVWRPDGSVRIDAESR